MLGLVDLGKVWSLGFDVEYMQTLEWLATSGIPLAKSVRYPHRPNIVVQVLYY